MPKKSLELGDVVMKYTYWQRINTVTKPLERLEWVHTEGVIEYGWSKPVLEAGGSSFTLLFLYFRSSSANEFI